MRRFLRSPALLALLLIAPLAGENQRSPEPFPASTLFVDTHVHLEPADRARSVEAALLAVPVMIIFMPPPFTADDPARYDVEVFLPAFNSHADKLAMLGGGGSLNAMIQQSARTGDARPEVRRKFKARAEELLRLGAVGFGELAAEHFQGATAYQSVPPDHPLFLLLADIAAAHDVPIVLHMEAVPHNMPLPASLKSPPNPPQLRANIDALERLLAHNRRAKIIWAHAGWDNSGFRTPELCSALLRKHSNLYMDLKIDPLKPGLNSPLTNGASGAIKPEWLKLFQDFPDRFVVGTDQHYPEPLPGPQRWQAIVLLLNQLPDGLRLKIAKQNAEQLYLHGRLLPAPVLQ